MKQEPFFFLFIFIEFLFDLTPQKIAALRHVLAVEAVYLEDTDANLS